MKIRQILDPAAVMPDLAGPAKLDVLRALCVPIAELNIDAKSVEVEAPEGAGAVVEDEETPASCCSIAWMRAWTAAMMAGP